MQNIDSDEIAKRYNGISQIWDPDDRWHYYTHGKIKKFLSGFLKDADKQCKILNAGSGGYFYGFEDRYVTHIDIAEERIKHLPNSIVGDIQNIPANANEFDIVICVGSVLNYCDPFKAIPELSRVLKPKGKLILEFENSNSLEFIGKRAFNKRVAFERTFYKNKAEDIWFYSDRLVQDLLKQNSLRLIKSDKWHILSPLVYRLSGNHILPPFVYSLDKYIRPLTFNLIGGNTALLAEKES